MTAAYLIRPPLSLQKSHAQSLYAVASAAARSNSRTRPIESALLGYATASFIFSTSKSLQYSVALAGLRPVVSFRKMSQPKEGKYGPLRARNFSGRYFLYAGPSR